MFRRFVDRIVEHCLATGLVWGQELYLDATRVQANAATDSLQPRFAVEAHLAHLFAADGDATGSGEAGEGPDEPDGDDAPARLPITLTEEARAELAECAADRQDWIGRASRPHRATSGSYRRTADFRVSTTDPDATPMPRGDGSTHLGYQDHYVVDGGRARIILTALLTPAEVQENQPALDLLWHACFRWKVRPRQVTGDTKYGTIENIAAIERDHIRADVPLSAVGQRAGMFGIADFVSEAGVDTYRCPGHQRLRFISQGEATRRRIYEASNGACAACTLRPQCTTSK